MDYNRQLKMYTLLGYSGIAATVGSIGLALGCVITGNPYFALGGLVAGTSGVEAYKAARVGKTLTNLEIEASGLEKKLEEH